MEKIFARTISPAMANDSKIMIKISWPKAFQKLRKESTHNCVPDVDDGAKDGGTYV